MDVALLTKLNKAVYDCSSFLFNRLETDKNYAAFRILKSRRLISVFSADNQIELTVGKRVEPGFFKQFVDCRHVFYWGCFLLFHPL